MVRMSSPAAYDVWAECELISNPAIRRYKISMIWSQTKFAARVVPVE